MEGKPRSDGKPILALRGVNKSFGPIDVLHDITLEVRAGEVLCLLGDNGAGKSTLIKLMSGAYQPTNGWIDMAVIFITHQVMHAMAVGDHFAVLIRGAVAADFKKGEKSREEITDLMAGGETMAGLESQIEGYMAADDGHPPPAAH